MICIKHCCVCRFIWGGFVLFRVPGCDLVLGSVGLPSPSSFLDDQVQILVTVMVLFRSETLCWCGRSTWTDRTHQTVFFKVSVVFDCWCDSSEEMLWGLFVFSWSCRTQTCFCSFERFDINLFWWIDSGLWGIRLRLCCRLGLVSVFRSSLTWTWF